MKKIIHVNINDVEKEHRNDHPKYEYYKKTLVPRGYGKQSVAAIYEIPPLKSAVPYHYHTLNEEAFLILSGSGELKTNEGNKKIRKGDFIFFPANENGAHEIINTSTTETLIYIDFDTANDLELTVYPKTKKIGIWSKNFSKLYQIDDNVPYYSDEDE